MTRSMRKHTFWHVPNEDSNGPVHPRSLIRVIVVHMKKHCILGCRKSALWRFCMIRLCECTGWSEYSLHQAHMPKATFSDLAAQILFASYLFSPARKSFGICQTIAWKTPFFNKKDWYFSYFSIKNICCGYSLEVPHRGTSNEYPQHIFLWRNKKNIYWVPTLI